MTPKTTSEALALVPVKPTEAMLRPFYECPPEELELAWTAMLEIAKNQQARATLHPPGDQPATAGGEPAAPFGIDGDNAPDWMRKMAGEIAEKYCAPKSLRVAHRTAIVEAMQGAALQAMREVASALADSAKPAGGAREAGEASDLIKLAEKCSAEIGRHEGQVVWVKFHSQSSVEAFATGVVMSAALATAPAPAEEPLTDDGRDAHLWRAWVRQTNSLGFPDSDDYRRGWRDCALRTSAPSDSAKPAGEPSQFDIEAVRNQLTPSVWALQAFDRILSALAAAPAPSPVPASNSMFGKLSAREALNRFLDTAAAEGYVLAEIDAADLYVALFPDEYERAAAIPATATKPEPASAPSEACPHCGGTKGHWEGCRAPVDHFSAPSEGAIVDLFDAAVRTIEMSVDRGQAARVVRTLQKQVLATLAPTSPAVQEGQVTDEQIKNELEGIADEVVFAKYPEMVIEAGRAVLALAGGKRGGE